MKNFYLKTTTKGKIMNTTEKENPEHGKIIIGEVKPLDVKTLLGIYGSAIKADGLVRIDAETLRKMAEELIMSKSLAGVAVTGQYGASRLYTALHGVRSDHREMKPMPGYAYAIATYPPVY